MLVKICGLQTVEAAQVAIDAGADLLGMILVPGRARTVDREVAKQIVAAARAKRQGQLTLNHNQAFLAHVDEVTGRLAQTGPHVVGVFRNQPIDEVFAIATELELDFIQLHGSEDKLEYFARNRDHNFGIIPRYVLPRDVEVMEKHFGALHEMPGFVLPLLDLDAGGEGKQIDWTLIDDLGFGRYILAGGLTPDNLHTTNGVSHLVGVDVSGGVETDGAKDHVKIAKFVEVGKGL